MEGTGQGALDPPSVWSPIILENYSISEAYISACYSVKATRPHAWRIFLACLNEVAMTLIKPSPSASSLKRMRYVTRNIFMSCIASKFMLFSS
jgi:hypothetical protein